MERLDQCKGCHLAHQITDMYLYMPFTHQGAKCFSSPFSPLSCCLLLSFDWVTTAISPAPGGLSLAEVLGPKESCRHHAPLTSEATNIGMSEIIPNAIAVTSFGLISYIPVGTCKWWWELSLILYPVSYGVVDWGPNPEPCALDSSGLGCELEFSSSRDLKH